MAQVRPDVKVYVEQMYKLGYGYPLYNPDPAPSSAVRIGDVGYVTNSGRFVRLFNIFCPKGDPINNLGVPNGFAPMESKGLQQHLVSSMPAGVYRSWRDRKMAGGLSVNSEAIPAGASFSLSSTDQQWAALIIKRPATCEEMQSSLRFKHLLKKNYKEWHAFAREKEHDIKIEDLIFVTGRVMTYEWATAIAIESTHKMEFKVGGGGGVYASAWGSWVSTSSVEYPPRIGPTSPLGESISFHRHFPYIRPPPPNQCIFVSGWRAVPSRVRLLPRKIRAAAEPKDDGRDFDEENQGHDAISVGVGIDSDAGDDTGEGYLEAFPCPSHIYETARNRIFEESDEDVVFLHDDNVFRFNLEQDTGNPVDREGEGDILTKEMTRAPTVNFETTDEEKVGSLAFSGSQAAVEPEHGKAGNLRVIDGSAQKSESIMSWKTNPATRTRG